MMSKLERFLKRNGGYATMKELKSAGIHTRDIKRALEQGIITKLKRGVYKLEKFPRGRYESFVDIYQANKQAVVCLTSALAYHELTTYVPSKITVAVPNNTDQFDLSQPPVNVYFFRKNIYQAGIERVDLEYGSFKIYNKPKTVCDLFHFRNKLGEDIALEGLKNYLSLQESNLNQLKHYMKICRVKSVVTPYLKAILSA